MPSLLFQVYTFMQVFFFFFNIEGIDSLTINKKKNKCTRQILVLVDTQYGHDRYIYVKSYYFLTLILNTFCKPSCGSEGK